MADPRELYQEVILDHSKRPRNFRPLEGADYTAEGFNALCGDRVTLFLRMGGDRIAQASFQGTGCAISKASASMMTAGLQGKTREEAKALLARFQAMLTAEPGTPPDVENLGKLVAFSGVCEFPSRVKCASLAWHTLNAALRGEKEAASD